MLLQKLAEQNEAAQQQQQQSQEEADENDNEESSSREYFKRILKIFIDKKTESNFQLLE